LEVGVGFDFVLLLLGGKLISLDLESITEVCDLVNDSLIGDQNILSILGCNAFSVI